MVNSSFRVDPCTIRVPDGTGTEPEKPAHKGFYRDTFKFSAHPQKALNDNGLRYDVISCTELPISTIDVNFYTLRYYCLKKTFL